MRHTVLAFAMVTAVLSVALGQKIETKKTDRKQIIRLKTALGHLTVIELGEPVLEVASGSPSYRVQWRENKVFIQPTETEARTNLFIWTPNERLNYELEPASSVGDMDFAIDQNLVDPDPVVSSGTQPKAAPPSISDVLLEVRPVRMQSPHGALPVEVRISDVYEKDGQLLVRYTVFNGSTDPYSLRSPQVFHLDRVRASQSLYSLTNSQLSEELASKLKVEHRTPVRVLYQQLPLLTVLPGASATGIIALALASSSQPTVLSFQFPGRVIPRGARSSHPITAYLVR
ncbi:MAG: hypothetical protein JO249_22925 [Acidobacteria bacterium]|nr:hypothetical protein [Acidobacteriota bacterium]